VNEAPQIPQIVRVRHELKRRKLTVASVERMPPSMVRVALRGDELQGFTSLGFDDHIKVFFPADAGSDVRGAPAMRDFTPRWFDAANGELWVDFFLHAAGPAATWAAHAQVGQTLEIGGPKGSAVIALEGIDAHVLIGDETALPAISRRLEELPADSRALVVIETEADTQQATLATRAAVEDVWVPRSHGGEVGTQKVVDTLRGLKFPPGRTFFWVAMESHAARTLRNYLRNERGIDKRWIKAAGYWQRGTSGTHDNLADD
jgi:NADPH-dependent ferric siderophore reductase